MPIPWKTPLIKKSKAPKKEALITFFPPQKIPAKIVQRFIYSDVLTSIFVSFYNIRSSIRKVIYKLYRQRNAEYRTERDDDSGFITYWWSFNSDNVKKMMDKEADGELHKLRNKLEYERSGEFYQCHCQCVLFEITAEQDFWCEDCESYFEHFDNGGLIKELEEQIEDRKGENGKGG